jgi:AcrR family transcriptional regulator
MSPRPHVSDARTQQILTAAASVFARLGFHAARMEDIATAAGLSKGTLYLYFPSKDAVIAALLRTCFDQELDDLRALLAATGAPAGARLLAFSRRVLADQITLGPLLPVLYEYYAAAARQADVRQFFQGYFQAYREMLATLIRQGIDRGEFRAVDPSATAIVLSSLVEGLTVLWMADPAAVDRAALSEHGVRLVLAGLQATPVPADHR